MDTLAQRDHEACHVVSLFHIEPILMYIGL